MSADNMGLDRYFSSGRPVILIILLLFRGQQSKKVCTY